MMYYDKGWFAQRANLYAEYAKHDCLPDKTDAVFFQFGKPNAGWIDMEVYVNGKQKVSAPLSVVYDPFPSMIEWLESIVRSDFSEQTMRIDCEGRELYLHYEILHEAEVFVSRIPKPDNSGEYIYTRGNVNTHPELGLFYIYDSSSDSIPVSAFCEAKELINALYLAILMLARKHSKDFERQWYYSENEDMPENKRLNGWSFYNSCKSSLIEWNILSPKGYRHERPTFKRSPQIVDAIHMWCEYGDALFWHNGACCGNADYLYTEKYGKISLEGIDGLSEWFCDWEAHSLEWTSEQFEEWEKQSSIYIQKVRDILPDDIDLFYEFWEPRICVCDEHGFGKDLPMIVFNNHFLERC